MKKDYKEVQDSSGNWYWLPLSIISEFKENRETLPSVDYVDDYDTPDDPTDEIEYKWVSDQSSGYGNEERLNIFNRQLSLLNNNRIYVQPTYLGGFWFFEVFFLPSDKDFDFANNGNCQDRDSWISGSTGNRDMFEDEFDCFMSALSEGVKYAESFLEDN